METISSMETTPCCDFTIYLVSIPVRSIQRGENTWKSYEIEVCFKYRGIGLSIDAAAAAS